MKLKASRSGPALTNIRQGVARAGPGCVALHSLRWLLHGAVHLAAWLRGCGEAASWPESVGAAGGGGVMLVWVRESGSGCEWPGASG